MNKKKEKREFLGWWDHSGVTDASGVLCLCLSLGFGMEGLHKCFRVAAGPVLLLFSFILFIGLNLGGLLATVYRPAGPQVAKHTLFLFVRFARSILAFSLPAKQISDIVMRGEWRIREKERDIWPALFSLAESGSWPPPQNVWVLSECGRWHCSRSPAASSSSDLPGGLVTLGRISSSRASLPFRTSGHREVTISVRLCKLNIHNWRPMDQWMSDYLIININLKRMFSETLYKSCNWIEKDEQTLWCDRTF